PSWVTLKLRPAMATVPKRRPMFGLASTFMPTVPLVEPPALGWTVIHGALLSAFQLHPPGVTLTPTVRSAPPAATVRPVSASEKLQLLLWAGPWTPPRPGVRA